MIIPSSTRLDEEGWDLTPTQLSDASLDALRDSVFDDQTAGTRCLLDHPLVADAALILLRQLADTSFISTDLVAIQAIAFDKTATTNWKVAWHQDLMFPFARRATTPGYDLPTVKDGVVYARPPREVLECLLAVRLHLDDCGEANGPLRVSPGTHRDGIIRGARHLESSGRARTGDLCGQARGGAAHEAVDAARLLTGDRARSSARAPFRFLFRPSHGGVMASRDRARLIFIRTFAALV